MFFPFLGDQPEHLIVLCKTEFVSTSVYAAAGDEQVRRYLNVYLFNQLNYSASVAAWYHKTAYE